MRSWRRLTAIGLATVIGVAACDRADGPMAPEDESDRPGLRGDRSTLAVTCEADLASDDLRCDGGGVNADGLEAAVVFGGQGQYLQLSSTGVCHECSETDIFQADVTLQNLLPQEMGTPNASSSATDVFIFFHTGPTNGVVVDNADGTATFTASGQPYFIYSPISELNVENATIWLDPNETSGPKHWRFDTSGMPGGQTTFSFTVFVQADVPHPDGWVEISPDPAGVETGSTVQLSATARDVVGRAVDGRSFTWSSGDGSIATVDGTGLVTAGSTNRAVTITASSDGPEDDGRATVAVSEPLVDETSVSISDSQDGQLYFVYDPATASPSVRASLVEASTATSGPPASRARARGWPRRSVKETDAPHRQVRAALAGDLTSGSHVSSILGIGIDSVSGTTRSGNGGADLYVRQGTPPTTTDHDCAPFIINSDESCDFDDPASGPWYVLIDAGSDYSNVRLVADKEDSNPGYTIELDYRSSFTASQQTAIRNAADRWEQVITGDLRPYSILDTGCGGEAAVYDVNRVVDDLVVIVEKATNDGSGGVLASAGPCTTRSSGGEDPYLPPSAIISIDSDDLAGMESDGTLETVVTHELGHAVGIGSLWQTMSLLNGAGTSDPTFTGAQAIAAYEDVGGPASTEVPVEGSTGNPGTDDAHWRESTFDTELMTGFLDGTGDELSLVTVESLEDQGYVVDPGAADAYTLPGSSLRASEGLSFGDDVIRGPIWVVDDDGRVRVMKLGPSGLAPYRPKLR